MQRQMQREQSATVPPVLTLATRGHLAVQEDRPVGELVIVAHLDVESRRIGDFARASQPYRSPNQVGPAHPCGSSRVPSAARCLQSAQGATLVSCGTSKTALSACWGHDVRQVRVLLLAHVG